MTDGNNQFCFQFLRELRGGFVQVRTVRFLIERKMFLYDPSSQLLQLQHRTSTPYYASE